MKDVYTIIEGKNRDPKKNIWIRIGIAFENRDGSLNVKLNALPINGTLQIRDRKAGNKRE